MAVYSNKIATRKENHMKTAICLNPFDATNDSAKTIFDAVALIKGKEGPELAMYVASPAESQLNLAFDYSEEDRYTKLPKEKLEKFIKKTRKSGPVPEVKIIRSKSIFQRVNVKDLCSAMDQHGVDLVALPTHARKGMSRFLLGSFAETFMNTTKKSMILVNPKSEVDSKLKTILFATDWSDEDFKAFEKVLSLAADKKANVIVTHVWESPVVMEADLAGVAVYMEQAKKWVDDRTKMFKDFASKNFPKVKVDLENIKRTDRVEALICKRAKKVSASLIVNVSKLGVVGAILLGSVSRGVVREAPCPVLVLRG